MKEKLDKETMDLIIFGATKLAKYFVEGGDRAQQILATKRLTIPTAEIPEVVDYIVSDALQKLIDELHQNPPGKEEIARTLN